MPDYQLIAVMRIRNVVSMGRKMRSTSADIHVKALAVLSAMPKRMAVSERTFARGYLRALMDALWSDVEFCYRDAQGVLYSTHSDSTHRKTEEFYQSGRGSELAALECAHVWKGTDKPFTAWSVIGANSHTVESKQGE